MNELKKDFKKIVKLLREEKLISADDIKKMCIDNMKYVELLFHIDNLVFSLTKYLENIEKISLINDKDNDFTTLYKSVYHKQVADKIFNIMEKLLHLITKCKMYDNKSGL